jgi:phosphoserine phosphatase
MPVDRFLFDLDGTVTTEELLPKIARHFGVSEQIDALTRRTIQGDVPFETSLRERVAILGSFPVSEVQKIVDDVDIDPAILAFLTEHSKRCAIVTGNLDAWLQCLAQRLPVPIHCSRVTVADDRISGFLDVMDKRRVRQLYPGERLCAIGEGHNDLGMFENAMFSVAFGGVHPPAASLYDAATHAVFDSSLLCKLLSQL